MLQKLVEAKPSRLPKLGGLCFVNVSAKSPHPERASRQAQQQSVDSRSEAKLITQAKYGPDKERRQSGTHHWCTELRRVAAGNDVELHISSVETCVGSGSTKFCRPRELSDRIFT